MIFLHGLSFPGFYGGTITGNTAMHDVFTVMLKIGRLECNFLLQADTLTGGVTCTGHLALALHCELHEKFPHVKGQVA